MGTAFNYWHYEGSLTTPDCNEAVQFIVAERALPVTDAQVRIFKNTETYSKNTETYSENTGTHSTNTETYSMNTEIVF